MKKRVFIGILLALTVVFAIGLIGCGGSSSSSSTDSTSDSSGSSATESTTNASGLADGTYTADFTTDNSMFHANEADNGKGTLTVKNGEMTIHVRLASKNIVNLYPGTAEDAQKSGAELLQPTTETVTYSDGTTDEVNAFDIPVPAVDQEFDLALLGTKGTWYDHKVTVSNPVPLS